MARLTFRTARKILTVGDAVFVLLCGRCETAEILEICDGWLETTIGVLDFEEVGYNWFLTETVAKEKVKK